MEEHQAIYRENWQAYRDLGLTPYPAKDKNPIVPWKYDPENGERLPPPLYDDFISWEERYPNANIWNHLGSEFVVIDPDHPEAEKYIQSLNLPKCPTVDSGGKSVHRYFTTPHPVEPITIKKNGEIWLEIRTGDMGILSPPSNHPSTKRAYRWREGHSPWEIEFPELLLRYITR